MAVRTMDGAMAAPSTEDGKILDGRRSCDSAMVVPSMVGSSTLDWSMAGNILDGRWLCDGAMVVPSIVGKHSQSAVADRKDAVVGCPSAPLTLSTSSIPNRQLPIGRMQSSVRQSSCSQFQAFPIGGMLIGRMLSSSVRLSPMCRQLHAVHVAAAFAD